MRIFTLSTKLCLHAEANGQWHASGAHEREVVKSLNVFSHILSSFLDRQEELVYGHLGVILIESREKPGFQVNPRIDGATGQAPELIKGYPLKGADE